MKKIGLLFLLLPAILLTACQDTNSKSINAKNTEVIVEDSKVLFKKLTQDNVEKVTLLALPQNVELTLSNEQISELIDILNEIETGEKVSPQEIVGAMIQYQITNKDGSVIKIQDMNPYVVIDDNWYEGDDVFMNELEQFTDELI